MIASASSRAIAVSSSSSSTEHRVPPGQKLAVAASGDPRDPRTWSGTPANIIAALERRELDVVGLDVGIDSRIRTALYLARFHTRGAVRNIRLGGLRRLLRLLSTEARSEFHWDRPARAYRSRQLLERLQALGCNEVLHMGSLSLPVGSRFSGLKHYLYCDSTWHTLRLPLQRSPSRSSPIDHAALGDLERQCFEGVSHFFTTAQYVRKDLIDAYGIDPARITVVGTGRGNIEPASAEKTYRDGYILFCAKLRFEQKGGDLLLEAFSRAHATNDRLRLILVGQEWYSELAEDIPGVEGYGSVPWSRLQTLFHQAALFAMPAVNEPWGLVFLEALASRTPVLGLRRNALPEITGDGRFGFLVDDPQPEAISDAILDAFSDPERLQRMGNAGQAFCLERYSWDRVAAKIASTVGLGSTG